MKAHRGGGGRSVSSTASLTTRPSRLTPGKRPGTHFIRGWWYARVPKMSPPRGFFCILLYFCLYLFICLDCLAFCLFVSTHNTNIYAPARDFSYTSRLLLIFFNNFFHQHLLMHSHSWVLFLVLCLSL